MANVVVRDTLAMKDDVRIARSLHSLAANIRHHRIAKGWTQERLAEAAELEPRYVQTLESGRANPSMAVFCAVAFALEVPLGSLLTKRTLVRHKPGRPAGRTTSRSS